MYQLEWKVALYCVDSTTCRDAPEAKVVFAVYGEEGCRGKYYAGRRRFKPPHISS